MIRIVLAVLCGCVGSCMLTALTTQLFDNGLWVIGWMSVGALLSLWVAADRKLAENRRQLGVVVATLLVFAIVLVVIRLPEFRRRQEIARKTYEAVSKQMGTWPETPARQPK